MDFQGWLILGVGCWMLDVGLGMAGSGFIQNSALLIQDFALCGEWAHGFGLFDFGSFFTSTSSSPSRSASPCASSAARRRAA